MKKIGLTPSDLRSASPLHVMKRGLGKPATLVVIFALCLVLLARFIGLPLNSPVLGAPGDPLNGLARAAAQGPDTGPYTLVQTLGRGMVRSAAWSPDGKLIAVGGALGIWLYTPDLEDVGLLKGHTKAIYGLAFSPDSKRLASASHDMTVRIWDVATQTELHTMEGHTGLTVAVAWSPDGTTVASGAYDNTVRLWNADTGEAIRVLEGHTGWVNQVAFSADGAQVISSGFDGTIRVWDANTGDLLDTLPGTAAQWSESTGQPEEAFLGAKTYDRAWSLSPDGHERVIAKWDSSVYVYLVASGAVLHGQPEHADWLVRVIWSEDRYWRNGGLEIAAVEGNAVEPLSGDRPRPLRIWNVARGFTAYLSIGTLPPQSLPAASPDGSKTLTLEEAGIVRILDTASGDVIAELPGLANDAAWSPDGTQIAVAMRNGTVQIWKEE